MKGKLAIKKQYLAGVKGTPKRVASPAKAAKENVNPAAQPAVAFKVVKRASTSDTATLGYAAG